MIFLPEVEVKIAKNLANQASSLIENLGSFNQKIIITDKKIWQNCQKFFDKNLSDKILILQDAKPDEKNIKIIENSLKKTNLIIAIGSGTINDLCKFVSHKNKIPYVVFASAPSMNGYLSRNASIVVQGHKKTLGATLPLAVFCDIDVLKSAPKSMIQAGIGDSICFYSCWFDWLLSHLILGTKFEAQPFKILQKKVAFFVKNYQRYKLQDDQLLKISIELLLLSGAAMTMAGGSYPASQSEHLIAHAFEMKYPKKASGVFHGLQIAVTTQTSVKLQEKLLGKDFLQVKTSPFLQKNVEKFFGKKVANQCKKEYLEKTNLSIDKINTSLKADWKHHRKLLKKVLLPQKTILKILQHFQIKTSHKSLGLSSKQYQELTQMAKFIRNRFTCLDLQ